MAEFNPNLIAKPELEPLPQPKKEAEKKPAEATKGAQVKPTEKKPEPAEAGYESRRHQENREQARGRVAAKKDAEQSERAGSRGTTSDKQDEYEQKVADGKKHVAELNARFADWYYVISDEVYRKIHLGRDELFKKKEPANRPDGRTFPRSLPPSAGPQR